MLSWHISPLTIRVIHHVPVLCSFFLSFSSHYPSITQQFHIQINGYFQDDFKCIPNYLPYNLLMPYYLKVSILYIHIVFGSLAELF